MDLDQLIHCSQLFYGNGKQAYKREEEIRYDVEVYVINQVKFYD